MSKTSGPRILVAMDFDSASACLALAGQLDPSRCRLKLGKEIFTRCGPRLVGQLHDLGFQIFLDLKFHDIPNTVAGAVRAAADLGVWMVNVHASGGARMMEAAVEALATRRERPLLTAVTVLTSMENSDLRAVGIEHTAEEQVMRLARLSKHSGLDGVVCSGREAPVLRRDLGPDFLLVTPGIRPAGSDAGDQRRILTPADALRAGSDFLVIGRPITQAADPAEVCDSVFDQCEQIRAVKKQ